MSSLNNVLLHLVSSQLWASSNRDNSWPQWPSPAQGTLSSVTTAAAPAPRLHKDTSSGTPEGFVPHLPEMLIFTLSLSTRITQSPESTHQTPPGRAPVTSPDLPNMAAAPALSSAVAIAPRFRRALRPGRPAGKEAVAGPVPPWTGGRSRWTWPHPRWVTERGEAKWTPPPAQEVCRDVRCAQPRGSRGRGGPGRRRPWGATRRCADASASREDSAAGSAGVLSPP